MTRNTEKYTQFALCREMMETPDVIRAFKPQAVEPLAALARDVSTVFFSGEGSSRIFPTKRARAAALRETNGILPITEGATQSLEYELSNAAVFGASNSGRTRELVRLFTELRKQGHQKLGAVTANMDTPLEDIADATLVLGCGIEKAVAATKSVMEQALVWQSLCAMLDNKQFPDLNEVADAVAGALSAEVPSEFADALAGARTVYFAGRNDGVAEELTLKTNEIVRKRSDFLEGTYAAHGIEEVMSAEDVVVLVNPFAEEEQKLKDCLADAVGVKIISIAARDTLFPTLRIPDSRLWSEYVLLAGGWNLLVEGGLAANVNLDKPERARKVGNEV